MSAVFRCVSVTIRRVYAEYSHISTEGVLLEGGTFVTKYVEGIRTSTSITSRGSIHVSTGSRRGWCSTTRPASPNWRRRGRPLIRDSRDVCARVPAICAISTDSGVGKPCIVPVPALHCRIIAVFCSVQCNGRVPILCSLHNLPRRCLVSPSYLPQVPGDYHDLRSGIVPAVRKETS